MGWFTKKEKVPEIPMAPRIPDLPQAIGQLPELPSLPGKSIGEQFNNEVIKSAVQDSSGENEVAIEELPQDFTFPHSQQPDEESGQGEMKKTLELSPISKIESKARPAEPIFVRVDKFHEAKKDFDEIKKKVREIESILKKVKDIKVKEDQEVNSWNDELEKIKSRLSEIDENFFNRL